MKTHILNIALKVILGLAYLLAITPILKKLGKPFYVTCLLGAASGMYFKHNYASAIEAYKKALKFSEEMGDESPIDFCHEEAYKALGHMYENGLGVAADKLQAEEYYLRAGSRGNTAYEHSVAIRSYNEKYK